MNLLDEHTKSALDAGQTIVLSGGYIVMSPETFRYALETSCKETLRAVFDEEAPDQDIEIEANNSSMNQDAKCHFCGKENHWGTEYIITIEGGYNSDHDMETVSMDICAECLEKMLAAVS